MTIFSHVLVYPEGDTIEVDNPPAFNQLVDINGYPLYPPLKTHKMIVYRVYRISTEEKTGEVTRYYHLELVTGEELFSLAGRSL